MNAEQLMKQIEALREAYGKIKSINPEGVSYKKMVSLLESMDDELIKIVRDASIKFMSNVAWRICSVRGLND